MRCLSPLRAAVSASSSRATVAVFSRLRELDCEQANRVAFVSGGTSMPEFRAFLDPIPNARLEKPFENRALIGFVNTLVG